MKRRWWAESVGVSLLLIFPYFSPLILPGHLALYHHDLAFTNLIGGLLVDMAGIVVIGVCLLYLLCCLPPRGQEIAGACLAADILWRFVRLGVALVGAAYAQRIQDTSDFGGVGAFAAFMRINDAHVHVQEAVLMLVSGVLASVLPGRIRPITRGVQVWLAGFAFCSVFIIPQLVYLAGLHEYSSFDRSASQPQPRSSGRIVWILFDELSYELTLQHPPSGQSFPNFESLRAKSISFGDIEPAGYFTDRVIPSILSGQRIDRIKSTLNGKLLDFDPKQNRWAPYDPNASLFGQAYRQGWNPAASGWYNPYCRLFSQVLTTCFWTPFKTLSLQSLGGSDDKSVWANAWVLPHEYLGRLLGQRNSASITGQQKVEDYQSLTLHAASLIDNGRLHMIFLHLPVPHPPGSYNRRTRQLCACGDYLDNLSLADETLGQLRKEIDVSPWASETTIIISSDHSWRVPYWKQNPGWTSQEERVSRGQFDPRPVFLIHFANQSTGANIDASLNEIREHDIVSAMLSGEIRSPHGLEQFLHLAMH